MKTLAIIPARSGSKGIPHKNIMDLGGQPLICWSIKQAINAAVDRIVVSTDSKEYAAKIETWFPGRGLCPYIRSKSLARDDTPTQKVILDVLDRYRDYDVFVLLEPTAPLRLTADITVPLAMIRDGKAPAVMAVACSHRCHPAISFPLQARGRIGTAPDIPSPRRQALTPAYHPSGTVYAARADWYRAHKTFMSRETFGYIVKDWQDKEIDNPDDILTILPFLDRVK